MSNPITAEVWRGALRAERAYRLEPGDGSKMFIRFGASDGLRKGLLSGCP